MPPAAEGGATGFVEPAGTVIQAQAASPELHPGSPVTAVPPVPISAAAPVNGGPGSVAAAPSHPPGQAGLVELNNALMQKTDPHGFCGWEELEFERLAR